MMSAFSAALPAISLREFLPSQPAETAVIVCPGGSYFWLGTHTEGDSVARSLNQAGIAAYVLKYRTGASSPSSPTAVCSFAVTSTPCRCRTFRRPFSRYAS